jgi:hypothetical protein
VSSPTATWRDLGAQAQQKDSQQQEPNDLSRYERPREEPDDFRHRMLANIAAFAFTVALTAIGIWLAMSIADMRRTQDCVLMGRRDCVRISTPSLWGFSSQAGPHFPDPIRSASARLH